MVAIVLAALQILLLLLKAYFAKDGKSEEVAKLIQEAQAKLDVVAASFEEKIRYSNIDQTQIDHIQDVMDKERKEHAPASHK